MTPDIDSVSDLIRRVAADEMLPRFVDLEVSEIGEKTPGDFVTAVDLAMERRLTAELAALLPGSLVIGEEAVGADIRVLDRLLAEAPVWVVDPLDGTANFASGYPLSTVIVALVVEGVTRAGWIYCPFSGRMAAGSRGEGAWMGDRRLKVRRPAALREMNGAIYGRRFRQSDPYRTIWGPGRGRLGHVFNARCVGQEYLSRLQGRCHFGLYTRLNPWDHAAGCLLHEEAGGVVALFDRTEYRPTRSTPGALLAPDQELWDELHAAIVAPVDG